MFKPLKCPKGIALPATTLAAGCYNYMFFNCSCLCFSKTKTEKYKNSYSIGCYDNSAYPYNYLHWTYEMLDGAGGAYRNLYTPSSGIMLYTSNEVVY